MNNHRLPMPGEKPGSVWRPRQHKKLHPWYRVHPGRVWRILPLLAGLIVLWAGLQIWRATSIPVTVVVNGQPVEVRTHRRTVAGAVRLAGVRPGEALYLAPSSETALEAGMVITVAHQHPVIVHVDGQVLVAETHAVDPQIIVSELGIALGPGDTLRIERAARPTEAEIAANPALAEIPALPREIVVARAQTVIVNEIDPVTGEPTRVSFVTTAPTLGRALTEAGYVLYEADRVWPPPGTLLKPGQSTEVTIERATPVTVLADGLTFETRTHQTSISGLLNELGLALVGHDYVVPESGATLQGGEQVRVVRVREETHEEDIPIVYQTITVPDPDLELDQQRVIQEGSAGVLRRQVRVRTEDGAEVSRVVVGEWVSRQPQAHVVGYGTRIVIRTLETPDGIIRYWRKLTVLATSYSPLTAGHKQPGDPFFGLSATGAEVRRGVIAVDPRVISLGTWMYVPGYGVGRALDVGGAVKGLRIDLGYEDEYLVTWNTWVEVYLIVPVPPPDQIVWVLPE